MKLDRCVLAVVAVMGLAAASAGCKSQPQSDSGDPSDQGPPAAQTPSDSDSPQNGTQDDGMRRARRHRGRHGHGRWRRGLGGNRQGPGPDQPWGNRGRDPQQPPSGPDSPDNP